MQVELKKRAFLSCNLWLNANFMPLASYNNVKVTKLGQGVNHSHLNFNFLKGNETTG